MWWPLHIDGQQLRTVLLSKGDYTNENKKKLNADKFIERRKKKRSIHKTA